MRDEAINNNGGHLAAVFFYLVFVLRIQSILCCLRDDCRHRNGIRGIGQGNRAFFCVKTNFNASSLLTGPLCFSMDLQRTSLKKWQSSVWLNGFNL